MMVSKRRVNACSVTEDLTGQCLRDCGLDMGEDTLSEFFLLWHMLGGIVLAPEREDVLVWRWSGDGRYSSKSAYDAFFAGSMKVAITEEIWHLRAPYSFRFFAWLTSRNRCWTADILQRWGISCPTACPLCEQEPETLQHLLLG
jgi:hypothetical protein